jgi:hypothetical protein
VTHPVPGSCAAVCCLTTNRARSDASYDNTSTTSAACAMAVGAHALALFAAVALRVGVRRSTESDGSCPTRSGRRSNGLRSSLKRQPHQTGARVSRRQPDRRQPGQPGHELQAQGPPRDRAPPRQPVRIMGGRASEHHEQLAADESPHTPKRSGTAADPAEMTRELPATRAERARATGEPQRSRHPHRALPLIRWMMRSVSNGQLGAGPLPRASQFLTAAADGRRSALYVQGR